MRQCCASACQASESEALPPDLPRCARCGAAEISPTLDLQLPPWLLLPGLGRTTAPHHSSLLRPPRAQTPGGVHTAVIPMAEVPSVCADLAGGGAIRTAPGPCSSSPGPLSADRRVSTVLPRVFEIKTHAPPCEIGRYVCAQAHRSHLSPHLASHPAPPPLLLLLLLGSPPLFDLSKRHGHCPPVQPHAL